MSKLIYSDNDILNQGNAQTIVNTINCVGVMGAGIALEYKLRYPKMYEDYVLKCRKHEVMIGKPYLYKHNDKWILNFPTKKHWKDDSKLEWVEEGLIYFKENYKQWGITSIAFPKLGTKHGGLNWEDIKKIMELHLEDLDIPVYICLDNLEYPKGLEKDMTDYFNQLDEEYFIKIGVSKSIISIIMQNLPIKKFRFIRELKGVGKISYEKIYLYIFDQIINKKRFSPEIKFKKSNEISNYSLYSENISTNSIIANHEKSSFNKELQNQFKADMNSFLNLKDQLDIIEENLYDNSIKIIKNYLSQKHPDIDWNKYSIKGQNIEGKLNDEELVFGKIIIDAKPKMNDFDSKQKRTIKNALNKIQTSNYQYKYLFVADEYAFNVLQKYNRDYPQVEIINILNPKLKSPQKKLFKSDY